MNSNNQSAPHHTLYDYPERPYPMNNNTTATTAANNNNMNFPLPPHQLPPPQPQQSVYPPIPQQQQQTHQFSTIVQQPHPPVEQQQQVQAQVQVQQPQLAPLPPAQNQFFQTITTAVRINEFHETEDAVVHQVASLKNHPKAKLLLRLSVLLGSFSLFCTCLYLFTTPYHYFWPLHIIYFSVVLWFLTYIVGYPSIVSAAENGQGADVGWSKSDKWFNFHAIFVLLTSLKLIVMNFMAGSYYPWSVFPVVLMIGLFAIHANHKVFTPLFSHFSVHAICYTTLNFLFLVIYAYQYAPWRRGPWFLIVWACWGFVLLVHLIIYRAGRLNHERRLLQQQQQQQQQTMDEQPVLQSVAVSSSTIYPPQPQQQQQQTVAPANTYTMPPIARGVSPNPHHHQQQQPQQQMTYQQSLYH